MRGPGANAPCGPRIYDLHLWCIGQITPSMALHDKSTATQNRHPKNQQPDYIPFSFASPLPCLVYMG
jgi:hypothetical protein